MAPATEKDRLQTKFDIAATILEGPKKEQFQDEIHNLALNALHKTKKAPLLLHQP